MRSNTRTVFILLVALAMVAALAPAALAERPTDKPGKGNSGVSVEVETIGVHDPAPPYVYDDLALGYPFYWVNAMGDRLRFVLTVSGPSEGIVSWEIGATSGSTGGVVSFSDPVLVTYEVDQIVEEQAKARGQLHEVQSVAAEFTVIAGGETKVVPYTLDAEVEPDCTDEGVGLAYDGQDASGVHAYSGVLSDVCRWVPTGPGYWAVDLAVPADATRTPPSIGATLRDHVPGNWCTTNPENAPGGVGGDPRQGPVTGWFYLPETGICLGGGMGGSTMAVGNTTDFILVTDAHITLTGPFAKVPVAPAP